MQVHTDGNCGPKFTQFWNMLPFCSILPFVSTIFTRYIPLSCEVIEKRWKIGVLRPNFLEEEKTPNFAHSFSNLAHF